MGADEAAAAGDQDPHGSSLLERRLAALGPVVERHAPVVLGHPVGVRQLVGAAHDPVAGLFVDTAGALLDRVEDDVLVEARGHPLGQLQPRRVQRVEVLAGVLVLPGDDLLHALGLDQAQRGGELAHPEVEPVDLVLELAVVAELARRTRSARRCRRRARRPRRWRRSWSRRASRRRRRRSRRAGGRSTRRRGRGRSPRAGRSRWSRQ